jgi:hypothetical protein
VADRSGPSTEDPTHVSEPPRTTPAAHDPGKEAPDPQGDTLHDLSATLPLRPVPDLKRLQIHPRHVVRLDEDFLRLAQLDLDLPADVLDPSAGPAHTDFSLTLQFDMRQPCEVLGADGEYRCELRLAVRRCLVEIDCPDLHPDVRAVRPEVRPSAHVRCRPQQGVPRHFAAAVTLEGADGISPSGGPRPLLGPMPAIILTSRYARSQGRPAPRFDLAVKVVELHLERLLLTRDGRPVEAPPGAAWAPVLDILDRHDDQVWLSETGEELFSEQGPEALLRDRETADALERRLNDYLDAYNRVILRVRYPGDHAALLDG